MVETTGLANSPSGQVSPPRTIPSVGLSKADAVIGFYQRQLDFTYEVARDYGPIVTLWPGTVLVTGPAEVDAILRGRDEAFVMARTILDSPDDLSAHSASRARWQRLRRAITATMTPARIDEHMGWVSGYASALADSWLTAGHIDEVTDAVTGLTRDSIIRFCFGDRVIDPRLGSIMEVTEAALFRLFAAVLDWPWFIRAVLPRQWRARRSLARLSAMVREAMALPAEGGVVESLRGAGLSDEDMVLILRSTLLAALGMPAASIAWALVELARHPDEQEALAAELATHIG
ncbi:MAG: cytochrome P450, partial [Sciscionella sp.]|nr:cytochrome P450 [Sciscionella sp.]